MTRKLHGAWTSGFHGVIRPASTWLVALLMGLSAPIFAASETLVGELGDPARIEFEGTSTFSPVVLRDALTQNAGYLLASHPQAPLEPFLQTLSRKLQAGYQARGFPDAQVTATVDENASKVRVQVHEGLRYRCGEVKIVGAKTAPAAAIIDRLTRPAAKPAQNMNVPTDEKGKDAAPARSETVFTNQQGHTVSLSTEFHTAKTVQDPRNALATSTTNAEDQPLWMPGEPAAFGQPARDQIESIVKDCLAQHGLFFPTLSEKTELKPATSTADLIIEIKDEGPRGTVTEIDVSGNQKNSRADILNLLHLKPGMLVTRAIIATAEDKLWRSARFLNYDIHPEPPQDSQSNSNNVRLVIKVWEYEDAPRLTATLSQEEKSLLQVCAWLSDLASRSEDAVLSFATYSTNSLMKFGVDGILSPSQGMLLQFKDLDSAFTNQSYSIILAKDAMAALPPSLRYKLVAPKPDTTAYTTINLLPAPPGSEHQFMLTFGAGFDHKGEAEARLGPTLPFRLDLKLAPVAFLRFAHGTGSVCRVEGKTLSVTGSNTVLTADAASGRLLEFRMGNGEYSASVRFVTGAFEKAKRALDKQTASIPNRFSKDHPASSILAFALTEFARLKFFDQFARDLTASEREHAMQALNKLLVAEVLSPMDRAAASPDGADAFVIPFEESDRALTQNGFAAIFAAVGFKYSNEVFPKYSWPWTAAREAVFVLAGQTTYTEAEIKRLYASDETGPLGSLVISFLLTKLDNSVAKTFAIRGMTHLSVADFQTDCRLFLEGNSGLARSFANIAGALRALPLEDRSALAAALPSAEAALLTQCAAALQAAPTQPLTTSLAPALNDYWEKSLRAKIRSALQRIAANTREAEGK